jgi:hypothetical protein
MGKINSTLYSMGKKEDENDGRSILHSTRSYFIPRLVKHQFQSVEVKMISSKKSI